MLAFESMITPIPSKISPISVMFLQLDARAHVITHTLIFIRHDLSLFLPTSLSLSLSLQITLPLYCSPPRSSSTGVIFVILQRISPILMSVVWAGVRSSVYMHFVSLPLLGLGPRTKADERERQIASLIGKHRSKILLSSYCVTASPGIGH